MGERLLRKREVKGAWQAWQDRSPIVWGPGQPGQRKGLCLGQEGGLCRGRQLAGLWQLSPGGGLVPSRMPSGLREGAVPGEKPQDPKRGCRAGRSPTPHPPHPLGRMSHSRHMRGPKPSSSGFQSFLGKEEAWGGPKPGGHCEEGCAWLFLLLWGQKGT